MPNLQMLRIIDAINTGDVDALRREVVNWRMAELTDENGKLIPAFHYAAKRGQLSVVEFLLLRDPTLLDSTDEYNQTALRFAAANDQVDVVEFLARRRASLNIAAKVPNDPVDGYRAIDWAALRGYHRVVQCLTEHGAEVHFPADGRLQQHPIHIASFRGHLGVVRVLLDHDPSALNITDRNNCTPASYAAEHNQLSVMEELVRRGADLTIVTTDCEETDGGLRPIHIAAMSGSCEVLQFLLDQDENHLHVLLDNQRHLIHISAICGKIDIVNMLLARDANLLDIKDALNYTPLSLAAANGRIEVVRCLTELGADQTIAANDQAKKREGYLPIHFATEFGHYEIVRHLIENGADVSVRQSEDQFHLIHIAAKFGSLKIVRFLLERDGSLLNVKDAFNQTALIWASAYGHIAIVEYLISLEADLEVATERPGHPDHGNTPLDWAKRNNHIDVENALLLARTPPHDKASILPFVRTGEQALTLVVQDLTLTPIFLRDTRVRGLMTSCATSYRSKDAIRWYEPERTRRRPSFYGEINILEEKVRVYHPVRTLGEGTYGVVRLFRTDAQTPREVAVKSLREDIINPNRHELSRQRRKLRREAGFDHAAYPEATPSDTFEFLVTERNPKDSDKKRYKNRYVMEYVNGKPLHHVVPQISCPRQLAEITLLLAKEVARIHAIGIIHGDLGPPNIMLRRSEDGGFTIRVIDFGCASYLTDDSAILWGRHHVGERMPPEICNDGEAPVKPHPNQDVFTIGHTLNYVLEYSSIRQSLFESFPCIEAFIRHSQNSDPSRRPTLQRFIQQLKQALHPSETAHVSSARAAEARPQPQSGRPPSPIVAIPLVARIMGRVHAEEAEAGPQPQSSVRPSPLVALHLGRTTGRQVHIEESERESEDLKPAARCCVPA